MLWLALHFSSLPLEVYARAACGALPLAVVTSHGSRCEIIACNDAAQRLGVRAGLTPAAASALTSDLHVVPRDEKAEAAALERIAAWAIQFTPAVAIAAPSEVLLEIEGSLQIFGGLNVLWKKIEAGVRALGLTARIACAPTPLAAQWFSRAGLALRLRHVEAIATALPNLPLEVMRLSEEQYDLLSNVGAETIGECLRLPRDGLARRLGQRFLDDLDRAVGKLADPRLFFSPPTVFEASQPLPAPAHDAEMLVFAARRLLTELCGYLAATSLGAQQLVFTFDHHGREPTRLKLSLVKTSRDLEHLTNILRERLEHTELPCPALEIALKSELLLPLASSELSFFPGAREHEQEAAQLIERLRARLGDEAVIGLKRYADHRPERAWRTCEPGAKETSSTRSITTRPLWLLSTPQPLDEIASSPCYDGRLMLLTSAERIESGWWDGEDATRDYFVAANPAEMLVWIYRDRRAARWFLHGFFA